MHGAILGFEDLRDFVLLTGETDAPFWWLQSIQEPAVAFVVTDPYFVKPDYKPLISRDDCDFLDIAKEEDIALLAIITIRTNPKQITANLKAPILINAATRKANQIILDDPEAPIQYDVIENRTRFNKKPREDGKNAADGLNKAPCAESPTAAS
jgi:flagellar assembly factor FliW